MAAPAELVVDAGGRIRAGGGALAPMRGGVCVDADAVAVRSPGAAARFYRHGWHSFSPTCWEPVDEPPRIVRSEALRIGGDDPQYSLSERHGGSGVGAVEADGNDRVVLLGALCLGGRVEWAGDHLRGVCAEPPGRWFVACGPETNVFAAYAAQLAETFGARRRRWPRTWMSWYSFYADIDEPLLTNVIDDLDGLGFEAFVVDDGWERSVGDWRPGPGFGSGMERIAGRARAAGMQAGLWMAPFLAPAGAPVLDAHPEWFVTDDDGALVRAGVNWGGDYFGIDLAHPEALAYVVALAEQAVAWGFELLKLDFLFAGAIPGRRHGGIEREHAYRQGIEAIRAAVGDDVRLLACGAPIIPSVGVFDAIRIGPDVAPWWENGLATHLDVRTEPATRGAIVTSLHRLWLAPVIGCDPDVVYVRDRRQMLSAAQRGLLIDLARICRHLTTSDPPAWLDADERGRLAALMHERDPVVTRVGRYAFSIDGRTVDYSAVVRDAW